MNELTITIEDHNNHGIIAWFDKYPDIVVYVDTIEQVGIELVKSLIAQQICEHEYKKMKQNGISDTPALLDLVGDNKYKLAALPE